MFDSGYGMVVGEAEGGSALLQPGELLGTVPLRLCASVSSGWQRHQLLYTAMARSHLLQMRGLD